MNAAFHLCVSGYTQTRGYCHGILKLREELVHMGHSNGLRSRVWYLPWTTNWKRVAADAALICMRNALTPAVGIYGYSYGGWGAIQMAKALDRHGIDVRVMVLSDPVGRPWFWPRPLPAATSLLGRQYAFRLRIPQNVQTVYSFYQLENRPQGHRLKSKADTTAIEPVRLKRIHQDMDDAPEFHSRVLHEAALIRESLKFQA